MAQADWERRQAEYLKYCELPEGTEDRTFTTFKAYNTKLKEALEAAKDVVSGKIKFLTLSSDVDRGKTHLAIAICRSWLGKGRSAKYAFVPLLLDELREGFQKGNEESYYSMFEFYRKVGLLVLDDLGAEHKTEWAIEKLETIIDYRYINQLSTVITTNCSPDEFPPRIRSRIQRAKDSKVIVIDCPEYRLTKRNNLTL
jgi:DNA replication protein DnaC